MIDTIQNSDGNPILRVDDDDNGNPVEVAAQPTSAPAAQSEVAAAPAEPAAEAETSTPPVARRRLSNAQCIAILTGSYIVAKLDDTEKRALFRAVHALARRVAQKERNERSRAARKVKEVSA